jgi:DTW domain-containing protein YfiP
MPAITSKPSVSSSKRPKCPQCLRAQSACICQWIRPVANSVEVLILQHPLEVDEAKNTARLLHLSLEQSRMVTTECLSDAAWWAATQPPKTTVLLYPDTAFSAPGTPTAPPPPVPSLAQLQDTAHLRLVVLDATWRKSRKMLHLNPALQLLPRMALSAVPDSRYLIRKAHQAGQLSTLEATCVALMQLEGDAEKYAPLLNGFDGFVAQQLAYRPGSGR